LELGILNYDVPKQNVFFYTPRLCEVYLSPVLTKTHALEIFLLDMLS